jgi:glucose-1-phosphate adenylyltransferase
MTWTPPNLWFCLAPTSINGLLCHDCSSSRVRGSSDRRGASYALGAGPVFRAVQLLLFDWRWLSATLPIERSALDFHQDIVPGAVAEGGVAAYCLRASPAQSAPYWRNVSTLDSLRRILLDFAGGHPCTVPVLPGPLFRLGLTAETSTCPILRPDPSLVESIALPGTHVLPGARLRCAIVAPGTIVPADLVVGGDPEEDAHWFRRTDEGTVLITNAMLAQRSGRVYPVLRGPLRRAFDPPLLAL